MIGIEMNEDVAPLRHKMLFEHHIFTGVAGKQMIRLLAPLCLTMQEADTFLNTFNEIL